MSESAAYGGGGTMSANGNARPVITVMVLVLSACLSISQIRAQNASISIADAEVFVYGNEQAIVDAMTKASDRQASQHYCNDLDHVFLVLLDRAYPKPEAHNLIRHSVDALC